MGIRSWVNSKIKKLKWEDIASTKLCCLVLGIWFAAIIPSLITINAWLLFAIAALLSIRPIITILRK